jgi:flagellar basal-body rod protein FlgC
MKIDGMFTSLKISSSGLSAQRKRLDAIASNLANVDTTRTENGGPYKRQVVRVTAQNVGRFGEVIEKTKSQMNLTNEKHISEDPSFLGDPNIKIVNSEVIDDKSEPRMEYDPSHPDANSDGYVAKPNINPITEMVDMISATRTFEANANAINAAKTMYKDALDI